MTDQTAPTDIGVAADNPEVVDTDIGVAADTDIGVVTETTNDTDDTPTETDDTPDTPNAEAAKYRRKLRAAEAERDKLSTALEATRRQVVERMVADTANARLGDPSDLWRGGVELAELVDEAGAVDAEKVAAAQARVLAEHPTWAGFRMPDLGQGARGTPLGGQVDFGKLLRDAAS